MRINKGKLFEGSLKFISRRMLLKFSYANKKVDHKIYNCNSLFGQRVLEYLLKKEKKIRSGVERFTAE